MNALHPLAVYAAVQAHKKEPLHYPGDIEAWYYHFHPRPALLIGTGMDGKNIARLCLPAT